MFSYINEYITDPQYAPRQDKGDWYILHQHPSGWRLNKLIDAASRRNEQRSLGKTERPTTAAENKEALSKGN